MEEFDYKKLFSKKAFIFDFDGTLVDSMKFWNAPELWEIDSRKEIHKFMKDKYDRLIYPKDFAPEFVQAAHEKGIRCCIASHTPLKVSESCFTRYDFDKFCEFYVSPDDFGFGKSHPEFYLKCAEILGLSPSDCQVFEDNPRHALSAVSAGFQVIGINEERIWGQDEEILYGCAEIVFDDFEELYKEVQKI